MLAAIRHQIYRAKYRLGQHLPLTVPVDVSLELASQCNMHCQYCYHADQKNLPFKKGMMSWQTASKIVTQAAELGVHSLKMNYRGESTTNPIFFPVTKLAKDLAGGSTFIERITNSNFKFGHDRDDIFQGLCNQTKVKVSFDSFRAEVFETQRAGGNHLITSKNIDKFYNYPGRDNELVIQAVRTTANKDEDIEGQAKRRWPEAAISIRDMVAGRVEKDVSALESRVRDASERQTCLQAHVRLMFDWQGRAGVCCPDIANKIVAGDIHKMSLREIFNSEVARQIRRDLKNGKAFESDPCKNCSSFESFKGFKPNWNS